MQCGWNFVEAPEIGNVKNGKLPIRPRHRKSIEGKKVPKRGEQSTKRPTNIVKGSVLSTGTRSDIGRKVYSY
jgi:hypothetical protein